jgi:hypothetical protein
VHLIRKVCAGGIFLYGLSLSFGAVDWVMSLSPHWYSTIFGVYYFAASMQTVFVLITGAWIDLTNPAVCISTKLMTEQRN